MHTLKFPIKRQCHVILTYNKTIIYDRHSPRRKPQSHVTLILTVSVRHFVCYARLALYEKNASENHKISSNPSIILLLLQ